MRRTLFPRQAEQHNQDRLETPRDWQSPSSPGFTEPHLLPLCPAIRKWNCISITCERHNVQHKTVRLMRDLSVSEVQKACKQPFGNAIGIASWFGTREVSSTADNLAGYQGNRGNVGLIADRATFDPVACSNGSDPIVSAAGTLRPQRFLHARTHQSPTVTPGF